MTSSIPTRQHTVKAEPQPPSRTPAGDAFTDLVFQVVQLIRLFSAAGEELARPAGQTLARWLVLEAVQREPATVAGIARTMQLTRQSVQRVADLLVREGFAVYQDNPAHRRAKLVTPTPAGMAALRAIQVAQARWADGLGAELGERELRAATRILDRVLEAMRKPELAP
jgi:DNA-binding MarR family transcriptional regulator